jgi:hypothetical protein
MRGVRREAIAWCVALAAGLVVLAAIQYRVGDPDSRLYSEIAERLARQPVSRWIAPDFPPGSYMHGLFREHPAGLFLLPALLARLGYPAAQASYAASLLYQVLTILLIPVVAVAFAAPRESRALSWLLQLLPIAFTFRIRANHEAAVLLCFLVALLGTERALEGRRFGVVLGAAGLMSLMLVKGLLVLPAFLCCALWAGLQAVGQSEGVRRGAIIRAFAAWVLVLAIVVAGYETAYRGVTGVSFLQEYIARGFSVGESAGHSWTPWTVAYNLLFYSGRVLWFAFPWSLAFVVLLVRHTSSARRSFEERWRRLSPDIDRATLGAVFVVGAVLIYLGLFSLSGRRAERYVFPVYFLVGGCGAVTAFRRWSWTRRLVGFVERSEPFAPVIVWVTLFALHLFGGLIGLPRIQIWRP